MKLKKFNIKKAYFATLNSGFERPWSSKKNKYLVLKYKYQFVKNYCEKKLFDYKKTSYYKFLNKSKSNSFKKKYEGSINFAYSNPRMQCLRFLKLIKIFKKQKNYIIKNFQNINLIAELFLKNTFELNDQFPVEVFDFRVKKIKISEESKRFKNTNFLFNNLNLYKLIPKNLYIKSVFPSGKIFKKKLIILNGTHRLALFYYFSLKKLFPNYFYYLE